MHLHNNALKIAALPVFQCEGYGKSFADITVNICIDGMTTGKYSDQTAMSYTPIVAQVASLKYTDCVNTNNSNKFIHFRDTRESRYGITVMSEDDAISINPVMATRYTNNISSLNHKVLQ
jgi:phage-related protein